MGWRDDADQRAAPGVQQHLLEDLPVLLLGTVVAPGRAPLERRTPADAIAHVRRAGAALRTVYATGGAAALARHLADPMTGQKHVGAPEKIAIQRAVLCGAAGRLDEAFESLDVALAAHEPALVHLAVAPQWDSLREAPRFSQCLRTMAVPDCRLM